MTKVDHVASKIRDMNESACNDKIAWSRHGAITYIRNGLVYLCYLETKDGSEWSLTDPLMISDVHNIHTGRPIVHLSWNSTGTDLACIDDHGGISIFTVGGGDPTMMTCLHQPRHVSSQNQPAELNRIVGFKWLDLDKGVLFASPATLHEESQTNANSNESIASYGVFQSKTPGPHHPAQGKYACMSVNKRGVVQLYAQMASADTRYYETSVPLDSDVSSSGGDTKRHTTKPSNSRVFVTDIISHAAIQGSRENLMYISAYFPLVGAMKTYTISIKWASSITGNKLQTAGYNMSEVAQLDIKHTCVTQLDPPSTMPDALLTQLLSPLPPLSKTQNEPFDYTVLALFSSPTQRTSKLQKYELKKKQLPFLPNVYTLSNQTQSEGNPFTTTEMHLTDSRDYQSAVMTAGYSFNDLQFWTVKFDGTVETEFRGIRPSPKSIITPFDVGVQFEKLDTVITHFCMSPTMCSYVYLDQEINHDDTSAKINPLKRSILSIAFDISFIPKLSVSLAVIYSISCFFSMCGDDIFNFIENLLKSAPRDSRDKFLHTILLESHRSINFTLDFPKDYQIDKVIVNPSLQRLLSLQMVLGTSKTWQRNLMGKLGWTVLNLRLLAFALTFTHRIVLNQQQKAATSPNASLSPEALEARASNISSMVGLIRWCTDFVAFLSKELYLASLENNVQEYLTKRENKSLALSLLLGRVPRMLLTYAVRGIRGLEQIASQLADSQTANNGGPVRAAFYRTRDTTALAPVSLLSFDKILADVESAMKNVSAKIPSNEMLNIEQSLVFDAIIPEKASKAAEIAIQSFKALIPELDLPKLYFYDVAWLGLGDCEEDISFNPAQYAEKALTGIPSLTPRIDMLRKQIIAQNQPRERRCVRCFSHSYWAGPESVTHWTLAFQKNCFCGGNWYPA